MTIKGMDSQVIRIKGEPVTITRETINKTCDWFAQNKLDCIAEVESGKVYVNNISSYRAECMKDWLAYTTKEFEPWLGFWQRAYYIQTGESISIL